jgi:two-component system LytT family response regulator
MVSLVIIDDEKKAREGLKDMVSLFCNQVEVIGEAENVAEGMKIITALQPDVVLLDIQMPDGSGFELLRQLKPIQFKLVFITAYEEYAVEAFKFSAVDYLLKPVDPDELVQAIQKIESELEREEAELKMNAFLENIKNMSKESKKIVLKTTESIHLVNVKDIIRCESEGNYTRFFFDGGKKILVSKTLKEFDGLLVPYGFFRSHQSHLVNLDHILQYEKIDGGYLVMKDQSTVPVALRKKDQLIKYFDTI